MRCWRWPAAGPDDQPGNAHIATNGHPVHDGGRLVASALAAHRPRAVCRGDARARRRAAQDASPRTRGDDARDADDRTGPGRAADVPQLSDPHGLRPARVRLHPPTDRTMADRDGVVCRLCHRQQRGLRAVVGHVGTLSLLLAMGIERRRHLPRGALLLEHVLAWTQRRGRLGTGGRRDSGHRRLRAGLAGTRDRLAVPAERAGVPGVRPAAQDANLPGRRAHRAALDGPGRIAVPAVDAGLGARLSRAVRAGARAATGLPLLSRSVPRRAAGCAHQPRTRRPGRLRVVDGVAAGPAGGARAACPGDVPRHLLPGPAGRGAAGVDRRRDLPAASPGGPVGQRLWHAHRVGGAQAAGDLHAAGRRCAARLSRVALRWPASGVAGQRPAVGSDRAVPLRRQPGGRTPAAGGVGPGAQAGRCVPPGRRGPYCRHRVVPAQGPGLRDLRGAGSASGGVDGEP